MNLKKIIEQALEDRGLSLPDLLKAHPRLKSETVYGWLNGRKKTTNTDVLSVLFDALCLDVVPRADSAASAARERISQIRAALDQVEQTCASLEPLTTETERHRPPAFRVLVGRYDIVAEVDTPWLAEKLAAAMRRHGVPSARIEEIGVVRRNNEAKRRDRHGDRVR